jgi:CRP-like cAMP-binding protein
VAVDTDAHRETERITNEAARKIIHPKNDKWFGKWNLVLAIALCFTALITPFEIAFLKVSINVLFIINRTVDVVFCTDIFINLRLAYFDPQERKFIIDPVVIRRHYFRSWFLLDSISTIPYDIFDVVETGASLSDLKVLRILKLVKLTKLFRMIKASRSMKAVQETLDLTNESMNFFSKVIYFLLTIHWIACLWGLGVTFQTHSWAHKRMEDEGIKSISSSALYIYSLSFSVCAMVMGESENAIPYSDADRVLATVCMIVGGSVYAYLIGSVCGLISERDPATKDFKDACDLIHKFCREKNVSKELTVQLKEYFLRSEEMFRDEWYRRVYDHMPPSLQKSVALYLHGNWIINVPFLNADDQDEREAFTAHIVQMLEPRAFPPKEEIFTAGHVCRSMMIVTKGMATKSSRNRSLLLKQGAFFGDEMILANATMTYTVTSITYLNCNQLHQDQLQSFMHESKGAYPQTQSLIRKSKVRLTFLRSLKVMNEYFRHFHEIAKLTPAVQKEMRADLKTKGRKKTEMVRQREKGKPVEVKIRCMKTEKIHRLRKKLADLTSPELATWLQPKIERKSPAEMTVSTADYEPTSPVLKMALEESRLPTGTVDTGSQVMIDTIMRGVTKIGDELGSRIGRLEQRMTSIELDGARVE